MAYGCAQRFWRAQAQLLKKLPIPRTSWVAKYTSPDSCWEFADQRPPSMGLTCGRAKLRDVDEHLHGCLLGTRRAGPPLVPAGRTEKERESGPGGPRRAVSRVLLVAHEGLSRRSGGRRPSAERAASRQYRPWHGEGHVHEQDRPRCLARGPRTEPDAPPGPGRPGAADPADGS